MFGQTIVLGNGSGTITTQSDLVGTITSRTLEKSESKYIVEYIKFEASSTYTYAVHCLTPGCNIAYNQSVAFNGFKTIEDALEFANLLATNAAKGTFVRLLKIVDIPIVITKTKKTVQQEPIEVESTKITLK
jgi:hypothetical protein